MRYYLPVLSPGESLADAIDALEKERGCRVYSPEKRAGCIDRAEHRLANREWCVAFRCKANILAEAFRNPDDDEGAKHYAAFLEGRAVSSCSADFTVTGPMSDQKFADALGVSKNRGKQMVQEALKAVRLCSGVNFLVTSQAERAAIEKFKQSEHDMLGRAVVRQRIQHAARLRELAKEAGQSALFGEPDES